MSYEAIPSEILGDIFHLLCEKPIALHVLENRMRFNEFPWAVGLVCQHWRHAFLSYPYLWTYLSLKYHAGPPKNGDLINRGFAEMKRRTSLCLERSGQLPLTVIVSIQAPFLGLSEQVLRSIWRLLLSCSERWKAADLTLGNEAGWVDDLLECRGKISILESMSLSIDSSIFGRVAQESAFTIVPRLTQLKIKHYGESARWVFPWSQLTKFGIDISWMDFFRRERREDLESILSEIQNVEELRLIFNGDTNRSSFRPSSSIRLARVRFLQSSLTRYPYVFKWFEMPFLEHFWALDPSKSGLLIDGWRWREAMTSFISRSSCHIRSLTLQNCFPEQSYIFMETLTGVENLCITDPRPATLVLLIRRIVDSIYPLYLPNLRELQVSCCLEHASAQFMTDVSYLLKVRGRGSAHKFGPLERVVVQLKWGEHCYCRGRGCGGLSKGRIDGFLDEISETIRNWYPVAVTFVDKTHFQIRIELRLGEW